MHLQQQQSLASFQNMALSQIVKGGINGGGGGNAV